MFTRTTASTPGLVRRSTRPLVVAALCAAFVAAAPATAQAQTVDDADTVGDMVRVDLDEAKGTIAFVPVADRTLNDVSTTTLTHGGRRVVIQVDYVDLKKKAGGEPQVLSITMATNEGARRHLQLAAWQGHWSGNAWMYSGRWRTVECSVRHSIDYEANVTKLSFPRRCASNPRWVTFRVGSYVEGDQLFMDDALRDSPQTKWTLARSDRVHRETAS